MGLPSCRQNELMRQKEVPRAMRRRVRQYYNEIWARERPFNEEEILASLPFTLQQEVRRAMYAVSAAHCCQSTGLRRPR